MVRLPGVLGDAVVSGELRFPVPNPIVEWKLGTARSGEKMKVVGHDDVPSDLPGLRGLPVGDEKRMDFWRCEPGVSVLGANCDEDNCGSRSEYSDTVGQVFSLR